MIISDYERFEIIISDDAVCMQDLDLESSIGMGPHNL
jgi:hypothetical protein